MTQLPNGYLLIPVPISAYDFKVGNYLSYKLPIVRGMPMIELPQGEWEYIGVCSKDTIDFDCSHLVKLYSITRFQEFGYMDYTKSSEKHSDYTCITAEQSFRSLLQSLDVYFVNPLGEKPFYESKGDYNQEADETRYSSWQTAQSKVIDKAVILKRK